MDESQTLEVVNFTNIDGEDYEGMWGGKPTIIKKGETRPFPRFLAEHYCKHLVNKILINQNKDYGDVSLRKPLESQILAEPVSVQAIIEETPEEEVFEGLEEIKEPPQEVVETKSKGRKKSV